MIGLDLCEIARIEKQLADGDGFLRRYFTPEERAYLDGRGAVRAQSAAAMFAAKEAFLKALGVGLSGGVALADVGVTHDARGCPAYALAEPALRLLRERGMARAELSLTHEAGMAAAVCLLVAKAPGD